MWTSIIDLSPRRVLLTNLLGRFWRGAYFSSFAPLQVQNVPRQPLPDAHWVRVRNRLAGICGSDLHLIHANGDLRIAPAALPGHAHTYLGHEVVGEVIEIGDDVQQLRVGDRVVLQHGKNCLSSGIQPLCRSCASGNYGLCERASLPGPQPVGGGWSEEMLLHEQQLFNVPADMTDTQAVLLEPSAVAVHTVLRHVPQAGERVLIIGAGTIGLLTLQVVRVLAPQAEISVLARYPFQVEKATRMGATHIIYPQDSYSGVQQATQAQLHKGMLGNQMLLGGYDVIYDTIGTQKTLHNSLRWARARGTVVLVGLSLHMMHLDLTPIWYQEVNLIGTMGQGMETWPLGSCEQRSTFSVTTDLIMNGLLKPEQLITHHFALNNYRQALMTAMDKQDQRAIKVVFDYSLLPASVVPNVRASARQRKPATLNPSQPPTAIVQENTQPEPLQPVMEYHDTPEAASTWEKQTLLTVPHAAPTQELALDEQSTLIRIPAAIQPSQTSDAQKNASTVESDIEATEAMPAIEQHSTVDILPVTIEETQENKHSEQAEDTSTFAFYEEETQAVPLVHEQTLADSEAVMQAVPLAHEQATTDSDESSSEAPLDELEWLDIIAAEETQQEMAIAEPEHTPSAASSTPSLQDEQEPQPTIASLSVPLAQNEQELQSTEDAAFTPSSHNEQETQQVEETPFYMSTASAYEETSMPQEDLQYEEQQTDFNLDAAEDMNQEYPVDDLPEEYLAPIEQEEAYPEKDAATNSSAETLLTTKTTKAVSPAKHHSKNRHKGKNNMGSYRS